MANFKRKKSKRNVRCTICTTHRYRGNRAGRFSNKEEAKKKEDQKEIDAAELNNALCLWCGRIVELTRDGFLKYHRCAGGGRCDGSGKPKEV